MKFGNFEKREEEGTMAVFFSKDVLQILVDKLLEIAASGGSVRTDCSDEIWDVFLKSESPPKLASICLVKHRPPIGSNRRLSDRLIFSIFTPRGNRFPRQFQWGLPTILDDGPSFEDQVSFGQAVDNKILASVIACLWAMKVTTRQEFAIQRGLASNAPWYLLFG